MFLEEYLEEENFYYLIYNRSRYSTLGAIENSKLIPFTFDNDYQDYFNFIAKNPITSESKIDFYLKGIVVNPLYKDIDILYLKSLSKEFIQIKHVTSYISRQEVRIRLTLFLSPLKPTSPII